eukprot:TRINITY_DN68164_c0_g2_i1.p2 TRINITY_DN68164_c0_g2~~TRINITY_DN68164_c0_g2_i1.p2  ORF type:complete len:537 (-),score=300.02 TRINITY_DN68164_c0_g2_i1:44-1594(-)
MRGLIDPEKAREREERLARKREEERVKNRHWKEKRLDEMTERDWRIFKEDFNIVTRGHNVPQPMRSWRESGLPDDILHTLDRIGYKEPSAIQRQAIPIGLRSRDIVGVAETGSGKTCAFVLPMILYISSLPKMTPLRAEQGPYALVMAPTRELAQQISEEFDKFARPLGFRSASIVGGMSIQDQGFQLRQGVEVVIGTPGRLFDCLQKRYLVLNQCNYVVLDEADRMIDMKFEPQILQVMDAMPEPNDGNQAPVSLLELARRRREAQQQQQQGGAGGGDKGKGAAPMDVGDDGELKFSVHRQTTMFSATMPPKVELLARKYLRNPIFVSIGDRQGKTAVNVAQHVEWMTQGAKRKRLVEIVSAAQPPIIVFCNIKKDCDTLAKFIESQDINRRAAVIHGGRSQDQRMESLRKFKEGAVDILVATDVLGRGIDVQGVTTVVNYDLPQEIERYTHRIGRTGRAGQRGDAYSFVTAEDTDIMYDLRQALIHADEPVPHQMARHEAARNKPGGLGANLLL